MLTVPHVPISIYLYTYLPTYLSTYLPTYLPIYLSTRVGADGARCTYIYLTIDLFYLPVYLCGC